jgi:hypothetical protein
MSPQLWWILKRWWNCLWELPQRHWDGCRTHIFHNHLRHRIRFFQNNYSAIKQAGQELGEKPDLYYWMSTPDFLRQFIIAGKFDFSTARLFYIF